MHVKNGASPVTEEVINRILKLILRIAQVCLGISAVLDALLWFLIEYHVPSITLAIWFIILTALLEIIIRKEVWK